MDMKVDCTGKFLCVFGTLLLCHADSGVFSTKIGIIQRGRGVCVGG